MNNWLDDYINTRPRESLQLLIISVFLLWQSMVAIMGLAVYVLLKRYGKLPWWPLLLFGFFITAALIFLGHASLTIYIKNIFLQNALFWKIMLASGPRQAFSYFFQQTFLSITGLPFLMAGTLSAADLIQTSPHNSVIESLQKGTYSDDKPEVGEKIIEGSLKQLTIDNDDGTVLGVSKYTGKYLQINDRDINQVLLVLGTTGSGKTISLRRFYLRAIKQGHPLIIVDAKPEDENIKWLMACAEKNKQKFYGFNCGNFFSYDPLANGGYTELKDKIISLKDEWSSDHYRSIAEDYLQATFEVLLKTKMPLDLSIVAKCLDYENLAVMARSCGDEKLQQRITGLAKYNREDITGLQAHLNILIHSELGQYFKQSETTFNLANAINENAVVYFALPALRFPSFSKVLGKLVINDIKAVVDRFNHEKKTFTVFDEFSVFAGEQVLNLVNMGRGKGVHAIFGTQGIADLNSVDKNFKDQVLNCVNTIICHRLNDQESAETVANWAGTKNAFNVTAQINPKESGAGLGSVRQNKEFIIHPDEIKQGLATGEAFYISKVGGFRWDKVRVKLT